MGNKLATDALNKIKGEIDSAKVVVIDPEVIARDHERGFVSTKTASTSRLYAEDEAEKAKADHAERAARIVTAQQDAAARGSGDLGNDPNAGGLEKEGSRDSSLQGSAGDRIRGAAQ